MPFKEAHPIAVKYNENYMVTGVLFIEYQYTEYVPIAPHDEIINPHQYKNLKILGTKLIRNASLKSEKDLLGTNKYGVTVGSAVNAISAEKLALIDYKKQLIGEPIYQIVADKIGIRFPLADSTIYLIAPDGTYTVTNLKDLKYKIRHGLKVGNFDAQKFGCSYPIGIANANAPWMPAAVDLKMAMPDCMLPTTAKYGDIPVVGRLPDTDIVIFPNNCPPIEAVLPHSRTKYRMIAFAGKYSFPLALNCDSVQMLKLPKTLKRQAHIAVATLGSISMPERCSNMTLRIGTYLGQEFAFETVTDRLCNLTISASLSLQYIKLKVSKANLVADFPVYNSIVIDISCDSETFDYELALQLAICNNAIVTVNLPKAMRSFSCVLRHYRGGGAAASSVIPFYINAYDLDSCHIGSPVNTRTALVCRNIKTNMEFKPRDLRLT